MKDDATHWPSAPAAEPFVCVGTNGTTFAGDRARARESFAQFQAIHLRDFFEPALLGKLMQMSAASAFLPDTPGIPGFREVEASPQRAGRIINLVLNRPELLRWLEDVTDCSKLDAIEGRLSQTLLRKGDGLEWHDDIHTVENRRLALVINFGTEPFTGGEFQLRRTAGEPLLEHRYTEAGSALLFRVRPGLEHRVLPLRSGGPRRVYAGWAFAGEVQ